MPGQHQAGRNLYMDPASLQNSQLDPALSEEPFSFSNSLTYTGSFSTSDNPGSNSHSLDHLATIDPSIIDSVQARRPSQPTITSFPSLREFQRPNLPVHTKTTSRNEHGSRVSANAPWTPIVLETDSMTYRNQDKLTFNQDTANKVSTDSGYEGSSRSNQQFIPPSHTTSQGCMTQNFTPETRETFMDHILPEQPSASRRRAPSIRSQATSSVAQAEELLDTDDLFCTTCDLNFATKSEHTKHMARHLKRFKCPYLDCKKTDGFATDNDLSRHKKSVHGEYELEDSVWKCFVDGCKSANKKWPRQDNFRAHIERMHRGYDVEEYVQKSDHWLETFEKPRRRAEANPTADTTDDVTDHQKLNMNNSAMDLESQSRSIRSTGGDFAYNTYQFPNWDPTSMPLSQGIMQSPNNTRQSFSGFASNHGPSDMMRTFSNNVNTSASEMTPADSHHSMGGPMIPIINTEFASDSLYVNPLSSSNPREWDIRTMPEMRNPGDSSINLWSPSPAGDNIHKDDHSAFTQDSNVFSNMIPFATDSNMMMTDDNISQEIAGLPDQGPSIQASSTFQVMHDHAEELRRKVESAVSSIAGIDHELVQKLAQLAREHSSSKAATTNNNSSATGDAPSTTGSQAVDDVKLYTCHWPGCKKSFTKKNVCKKHYNRHLKRWFCTFDGCTKHFGSKQDLQRHEITCNTQEMGWRCWCKQNSRAANKECAKYFTDKNAFERHYKEDHHGYVRRPDDEFRVDRAFAGNFWCGFCIAVVQNPTPGDTDGTPRLKYRYDHIDKHLDENKTMSDWYDLKGEGKTKQQRQNISRTTKNIEDDDEEEEDIDEDDHDTQSYASISSTPNIRRQRSETGPGAHRPQYLAPPPSNKSKRPFNTFSQADNLQANKLQRLQYVNAPNTSGTMPRRSAASVRTRPMASPMANYHETTVPGGWIKCCSCPSDARINDGRAICPNPGCQHFTCKECRLVY